ncbi:MAG TPA: hypothetical protein VFO76_11510 [Candidatus Kapabacteria bacterium]|nr:hypothetical protein [Candidatus Kapabacteria bacterium]
MPKQQRRFLKTAEISILTSPLFLGSLLLLFGNDFLFKPYFHNWITGKLSDFSGLIVFSLFWIAFFPRWKKGIVLLCGLAFTLWKLPISTGFITLWNSYFFAISRVIDSTDLIALAVLPLVYYYRPKILLLPARPIITVAISIVSLFTFCATSRKNYSYHYKEAYYFSAPVSTIKSRIDSLFTTYDTTDEVYSIVFDGDLHDKNLTADISYSPEDSNSSITLHTVTSDNDVEYTTEDTLRKVFEQKVIRKLGSFTAQKSKFYPFKWLDNMDGLLLMVLIIIIPIALLVLILLILFISWLSRKLSSLTKKNTSNGA